MIDSYRYFYSVSYFQSSHKYTSIISFCGFYIDNFDVKHFILAIMKIDLVVLLNGPLFHKKYSLR